jgi:hypothetical protein
MFVDMNFDFAIAVALELFVIPLAEFRQPCGMIAFAS